MAAAIETKLYVTNFPSSATRQQLQQFFSRFGRVQECAIMWNSYAFVHYATMEEARRALDQSNGAIFLNRKLIVQLSTSRFRPQPKEINTSPKQLMVLKQQQSTPSQYTYSEFNYDIIPSSSPPISDNHSSSLSQDYYSNMLIDRMTPSALKLNHMKSNKTLKTDIGLNGEIPKLYCTNLPENCKSNDLQRLFSSFGHVIDCVVLWDYYAFITYKTFSEAERALIALNGFIWKDRPLIVEWSRASGRKQQQTSPRLSSELSTPPSPRSNNQFYGNNNSFNQNLSLMSMMQQQSFLHHHHSETPFIDTIFPSPPSSVESISNVYQPSDIVALLEPSSSDVSVNNNKSSNPLKLTCSSAAAAGNLLSSLFNSFEPFNDEQPTSSRYNNLSPLLTTAPDNSHYPVSYGHNISWH
jgi:RNA recognition motif-containing protein